MQKQHSYLTCLELIDGSRSSPSYRKVAVAYSVSAELEGMTAKASNGNRRVLRELLLATSVVPCYNRDIMHKEQRLSTCVKLASGARASSSYRSLQ